MTLLLISLGNELLTFANATTHLTSSMCSPTPSSNGMLRFQMESNHTGKQTQPIPLSGQKQRKHASIHTLNTQMLCIRSNRHRRLVSQPGPIHYKRLASIPFRHPLRPTTLPVHRPRRRGYIVLNRLPLRLVGSIWQVIPIPRRITLALTRRKIPTPINLNPDLRAKKKRRVVERDGALCLVSRAESNAREALAATCVRG